MWKRSCMLLLSIWLAQPSVAQDEEEASSFDCAAGKAFLEGRSEALVSTAHYWIRDCNAQGDRATSAALEARMRQALDDSSQPAFERAKLGIRLAEVHVDRAQWDEAANLALAAQIVYQDQPERDEFITYAFARVAKTLAIEKQAQAELAAPHLDARVTFLDMLAGSELYEEERAMMLPLALTIALDNAWELKDLDRAAVHAARLSKLRASVDPGRASGRFANAGLLARIAHELRRVGRDAEARTIVGKDPAMLALADAFLAMDALGPPREDLDLALRLLSGVTKSDWWQAGLTEKLSPEHESVAEIIRAVASQLRVKGRTADAERLLAAQQTG